MNTSIQNLVISIKIKYLILKHMTVCADETLICLGNSSLRIIHIGEHFVVKTDILKHASSKSLFRNTYLKKFVLVSKSLGS